MKCTGPGANSSRLWTLRGVEIVHGDLTDVKSLKSCVQGVERIYNVAAKTGPWGLEKVSRAVNVQGLACLIHTAIDEGRSELSIPVHMLFMGIASTGL
jgi:uncharacterized protein YbjT (DUF2867 family)